LGYQRTILFPKRSVVNKRRLPFGEPLRTYKVSD